MSLYIYTRSRLFCAAALKAKAGDERINVIETEQTGQDSDSMFGLERVRDGQESE